jgi:hypothetical protein
MPFVCSTKFRTNAQKKRIDVWLIYRCHGCGETWNMPILERVPVAEIAPEDFQAIARNDPVLAMRHARDLAQLSRYSNRVEESLDIEVRKQAPLAIPADAAVLEISITLALPCVLRLDRLLPRELGVPRSGLHALLGRGALRLSPAPRKGLRSHVTSGQMISIDLGGDAALAALMCRRALA